MEKLASIFRRLLQAAHMFRAVVSDAVNLGSIPVNAVNGVQEGRCLKYVFWWELETLPSIDHDIPLVHIHCIRSMWTRKIFGRDACIFFESGFKAEGVEK